MSDELTMAALQAASEAIGPGPVTMVNLLWFRREPDYPSSFQDPQPDGRSAYYKGYAGAFRAIAEEMQVSVDLIHAGRQLHGLLAGPEDDWDEIVIVRYDSFEGLRKVIESEAYRRTAMPHRQAGVAKWRFFATRSV